VHPTVHPPCTHRAPTVLKLTKRTEYALIALVHLADREGRADGGFASVREIAERYPVPKRLVAEVLKELCKSAIVSSQRGAAGGYALARSAASISLGEVIVALEGKPSLTGCESLPAADHGRCDIEPVCPIKTPMQRVRLGIWDLMQRTTLLELAKGGRPGAALTAPMTPTHADPAHANAVRPANTPRATAFAARDR